jgi:hypothetical protein
MNRSRAAAGRTDQLQRGRSVDLEMDNLELQMMDLINAERARRGLRRVTACRSRQGGAGAQRRHAR